MHFFLALCVFLVESSDLLINTHHIRPLRIDKHKGNFSVTAINIPKNAFLVASYSRFTDLRIDSYEWVRNYKYYSIENYMNNTPTLYLSPSTYSKKLSITICSFTELIPSNASILITYNSSAPSQSHCKPPFKNPSCLINPQKLTAGFSKTYSIQKFSNMFFYSNPPLSSNQTLEIKVLSGNLHSFFKYNSNESLSNLASFLNTENDSESLSKSISFPAPPESLTDTWVSLSVFCFDTSPCNFTLNYKGSKSSSDDSKIYQILTIVLVVTGCVVFTGLWCLWIGYRRKKNKERENGPGGMVDKFFPLWTVNDENRQKECSICFEDYEHNTLARKSVCGHIYHADCIQQWLLIKPCCPLCRSLADDQRV